MIQYIIQLRFAHKCLQIPIHIAVVQDNIFLPLKDGISSVEHKHSLLGAEVNQIVDTLSLGWYELIFQSYMAQKVRKVHIASFSHYSSLYPASESYFICEVLFL